MSDILLSNDVIVFLFIETITLVLLTIAVLGSFSILKNWDFNSTSTTQYKLEKRSYLVILIIVFSLIVKIFLLPFFTYIIDGLSTLVPGAMCGAGVIGANEYGEYLLSLKIVILFFTGIWLLLNNQDLKTKNYLYMKNKLWLFVLIFVFIVLEFILDIFYLSNISTAEIVSCCSIIYGEQSGSTLPLGLDTSKLLVLFYLVYILSVIANFKKQAFLSALSNLIFIYLGYFAVVHLFGTYIYELPTHKCPFCMLQPEYNYIGYFIWTSLFLGAFFGISGFVLKLFTKKDFYYSFYYSNIFNFIFIAICTFYVLRYYLVNGVFL